MHYPKSLRGKMVATVVFLLSRPPSKTISGNKSCYRMLGKHMDLFFLRTIGTRALGDRQAHVAPPDRHLPFEELILDAPAKTSTFLTFSFFPFSLSIPLSNFPIQVSIVGACWNNWLLSTISIVPCIELFNHLAYLPFERPTCS